MKSSKLSSPKIDESIELEILIKHAPKLLKKYISELEVKRNDALKAATNMAVRVTEQNRLLKFFGSVQHNKFKAILHINEYPLGTKAYTDSGYYWLKTKEGWKFTDGRIMETPTKEFNGYITIPFKG